MSPLDQGQQGERGLLMLGKARVDGRRVQSLRASGPRSSSGAQQGAPKLRRILVGLCYLYTGRGAVSGAGFHNNKVTKWRLAKLALASRFMTAAVPAPLYLDWPVFSEALGDCDQELRRAINR
jgi:hypothetical protein